MARAAALGSTGWAASMIVTSATRRHFTSNAAASGSRRTCRSARRSLVQDQPVEPELLCRLDKPREVDRLAHETVRAEIVARQNVLFFPARRQHHHGSAPRPFLGAHALEHLEPSDLRKLEVEQDDHRVAAGVAAGVCAGCEEVIERLHAVARNHQLVHDLALAERPQGELDIVRVVFHQENNVCSRHGPALPTEARPAIFWASMIMWSMSVAMRCAAPRIRSRYPRHVTLVRA